MTSETISSTAPVAAAAPVYNPSEKQKGASKTSRIPIKIIPIEQVERLKKPDWIRVKAASASTRFYEIKDTLRENNLVTVCEEAICLLDSLKRVCPSVCNSSVTIGTMINC